MKSKAISILDGGLTVEGTISSRGSLMVRGTVVGSLTGEDIVVSRSGVVRADTAAERMTVAGRFEGRAEVSGEMVVLSSGDVSGSLVCGKLAVEPGGQLNAEIRCKPPEEPARQEPQDTGPEAEKGSSS